MNYFPFKNLPVEIQNYIEKYMDLITYLNFKLAKREPILCNYNASIIDTVYREFSDTDSEDGYELHSCSDFSD